MFSPRSAFFAALLLPLLAAGAPSATESLSGPELDEILSLLKTKSVLPLSDLALRQATVQGLLDRLGASGGLRSEPQPAAVAASPFRSEVLEGKIGYLRPGALNPEHLALLDQALADFAGKKVTAEVLDLRALPPGIDFEQIAVWCGRWVPKGQPLCTLTRREEAPRLLTAKGDPAGHGLLMVLTSVANAGSAEVIAAVLRGTARALVIGQKTRGEVGEFQEQAIGPGRILRFPTGEVILPWNEPLGGGVWPDVLVEIPAETTARVLQAELDHGVAPLLAETERPRLNEAALVAGRNPELDAMEAAQLQHEPVKPPLRDAVLQRAWDIVTSLGIFGGRK